MADQTQLDRVDAPTENVSATATGDMPSPKLSQEREQATRRRSRLRLVPFGWSDRAGGGWFLRVALYEQL